ncbi:hypothetical protein EVAR_24183_1 [Eumeta japonica]|uniref:Uncharacterized protein n=1 Tax=Eumeta variegata TaxID=151549 RepID=A0A4C1W517_EUMVA|nr:hypothetical protein EVAR_24183_1 [Eumeta japonica]
MGVSGSEVAHFVRHVGLCATFSLIVGVVFTKPGIGCARNIEMENETEVGIEVDTVSGRRKVREFILCPRRRSRGRKISKVRGCGAGGGSVRCGIQQQERSARRRCGAVGRRGGAEEAIIDKAVKGRRGAGRGVALSISYRMRRRRR